MLTDGYVYRDSLRQTKSNIDMIKGECLKLNRDPDEIEIAAIVYPNVEGLSSGDDDDDDCIKSSAEPKSRWQKEQEKFYTLVKWKLGTNSR